MIILDTNLVSEPLKPHPEPSVLTWLDRQEPATLYLAATSLSELLTGMAIPPEGRRRETLRNSLRSVVDRLFRSRILAFDQAAAIESASLAAKARRGGVTLSVGDAQIAAIAMVHGFAVASRDCIPFLAAGAPLIDPWSEGRT